MTNALLPNASSLQWESNSSAGSIFFAHEETPLETCLAEVAQSQLYILIVGHRYGATDANGISYTEREYLRAGELSIPRFVFLKDDSVAGIRDAEPAKQESVKRFRTQLADPKTGHTVCFFKSPSDLAWQLARTLANILPSRLRAARGLLPPPAPANFVGRDNELAELEKRLREKGIAGIAGVRGMGGIGKSTLAIMFAWTHIADYPDGLLWVTLAGRDPMLVLSDITRAFEMDVSDSTDLPSRAARAHCSAAKLLC